MARLRLLDEANSRDVFAGSSPALSLEKTSSREMILTTYLQALALRRVLWLADRDNVEVVSRKQEINNKSRPVPCPRRHVGLHFGSRSLSLLTSIRSCGRNMLCASSECLSLNRRDSIGDTRRTMSYVAHSFCVCQRQDLARTLTLFHRRRSSWPRGRPQYPPSGPSLVDGMHLVADGDS